MENDEDLTYLTFVNLKKRVICASFLIATSTTCTPPPVREYQVPIKSALFIVLTFSSSFPHVMKIGIIISIIMLKT